MTDPGVLSALLGTADRLHASPKVRKALIEAGLVESGIRNLPYGDRDSLGVLQERTSIYGRAHALSPTASAERFIRAAQTANRPGLSAGALAQAVQRSAFPARYDEQSSAATRLLGQNPGGGTSGGSGAGSGGSLQGALTSTPGSGTGFNPGTPQDPGSLSGLLQQPQAPPVPFPVAPTPAFQSPVIQPAQPPSGLADALAQVASTVPQGLPDVTAGSSTAQVSGRAPTASAASVASGRTPTTRSGKIIGTPYAGTHTLGNWQSDNAVDIAVPIGTPMVALQNGTIVKVTKHPQGAGRFAGDQITVRGANGNEYFYAHGVASVKAGEKVRKGQQLGTTGSANGVAHLHYAQMKGSPYEHVNR